MCISTMINSNTNQGYQLRADPLSQFQEIDQKTDNLYKIALNFK